MYTHMDMIFQWFSNPALWLDADVFYLDLFGTFIFAYAGAVIALRHGFNLLGAMVIGLVTATGGGTIRCLLIGSAGIFWIEHYQYLLVVSLAVVAALLPRWLRPRVHSLSFHVLDAFSTAVFISLGLSTYGTVIDSLPAAISMAALTGMGGGLLRDTLVRRAPQALTDPAYPIVVIGGCAGGLLALQSSYPVWAGSVVGVLAVELLRGLVHVTGIARHHIGLTGTANKERRASTTETDPFTKQQLIPNLATLVLACTVAAIYLSSSNPNRPNAALFATLDIPISDQHAKAAIMTQPAAAISPVQPSIEPRNSQTIPSVELLDTSDIRYAEQQFNRLATAIRLRNTHALTQLTAGNNDKQSLFDSLFERYVKIDLSIVGIHSKDNRVVAALQLNSLLMPDGNLVYPSNSYKTTTISMTHAKGQWSRIQW